MSLVSRDKALESVKTNVIAEAIKWADEDDPPNEEITAQIIAMTNLSEIAIFCQEHAWDVPTFIAPILALLGFTEEDMSRKWLNEHMYGWDT